MNNRQAGKLAEFVARMYMRCRGYRIVASNVVMGKGTHAGEVDFIACRGKNLVFVEVKKRTSMETAAYAISPQQQQRIINGAKFFIQKNPQFQYHNIRFDAILVVFPLRIQHIQNAWQ